MLNGIRDDITLVNELTKESQQYSLLEVLSLSITPNVYRLLSENVAHLKP